MSMPQSAAPANPTDAELVGTLEEVLREHFGKPGTISRLARRPYVYQSSFPLEELEIVRSDGTFLHVILKNLGWQTLPTVSRQAKPAFLHDPLREIVVYRQILKPGLG